MPKTNKVIQSFNAGELSELMDPRIDQKKYAAGCRTMENFIPLIYGGAQERPGLEFIAAQKSSSAKGRVIAFEHSVDDTYILLFENQVIRVFKDGTQVLEGVGTEDISALGSQVAHWQCNETVGTIVVDSVGVVPHNGTATVDTSVLTATGQVGSGSFNLDGQYTIEVSDAAGLSFTNDTDDEPFSVVCWANIVEGEEQVLLSKWRDDSTTKEYRFRLNSDRKLQLHLADTSASLSANTISQWKLNDDAADTIVVDGQGTQNGVASSNTDTLTVTGQINAAFDFTGTDAVQVDDNAAYSFDDTSDAKMSIGAWVFYESTTATQEILSKWNINTSNREWAFSVGSTGKLRFVLFDEVDDKTSVRESDNALSPGWHFVCGVYDSSDASWTPATATNFITLYIDGVVVSSTATNDADYSGMTAGTSKVVIGALFDNVGALDLFWKNKLDNIMLFDIAITQANVSALYNSGTGTESLVGKEISATSNDVIGLGWRFLGFTYAADDNGSATAANGIILYVDGVAVNSTKINDADYTAMQDGAEEFRIGSQRNSGDSANENFLLDKIDEISLYSDVLTPTEIASLYSTTPLEIITPYLTTDLFSIKFEQSADVMFITHPDYESRRLSRRGDIVWTLEEKDLQTGPFRDENTDTAKTITASATTGTITLTAIGHSPFVAGTTKGHEPSGSLDTSKSKTGALFKLVHAVSGTDASIGETLNSTTLNAATSTLTIAKGITWDFTTNGTWGTGGPSSIVLERSYDNEVTYETVHTVTSLANKNVTTSGTEENADALYRARVSDGSGTGNASIQLSIRDTSHIGIVEITSVTSSTVALGTVLTTLGATDPTHRFSEGSFSNFRGWPIDVVISAEERLTFAGNRSEPLSTWGSVIGDFTDFKLGTDDDDALNFTLVGSGQQNRIRWMLSKDTLVLGTVGGEHLLGASKDEEALTPSNVKAKLQTSYGSEDIAAILVNQAVLFVQRGGKKIREFLFDFESDSHKADDLTVFSNQITGDGITDMAFQRTPDPMLWCIRTDGQMAVMNYERDQDVFSWSRLVSKGGTSDAVFESVAVIYGGERSEDEVWVTIKREINTATTPTTVRYVERFFQRDMPALADMKFLDSYITDTGGDTTITGLGHLEGETVQVLGDGLVQATKVVSSSQITAATTATKYQVGLGYTALVKPMKIDLQGLGLSVTKKVNRGVFSFFETIGGEVGINTTRLEDVPTGTAALFTGSKEISLGGGYSREGDILARQTQPLPMTVLSFTLDIGANND